MEEKKNKYNLKNPKTKGYPTWPKLKNYILNNRIDILYLSSRIMLIVPMHSNGNNFILAVPEFIILKIFA